jgi:DNA-binding transcriptional ArsR family regulator
MPPNPLAALGDPTRRAILELLAGGEQDAGSIAARFPVSRPAVSRHLRVLREAGITKAEVRGREWWYTIEPAALVEMESWLEEVRTMWRTALRSLKDYVEDQNG